MAGGWGIAGAFGQRVTADGVRVEVEQNAEERGPRLVRLTEPIVAQGFPGRQRLEATEGVEPGAGDADGVVAGGRGEVTVVQGDVGGLLDGQGDIEGLGDAVR